MEQLQLRPVSLPVCPALAPRQWWQEQGLMAVAEQPTMRERLWLLLADDLELPQPAQVTLRLIRRLVNRAAARGDEAISWPSAQPHVHGLEPLHQPALALFAMQHGVPVAPAPMGAARLLGV